MKAVEPRRHPPSQCGVNELPPCISYARAVDPLQNRDATVGQRSALAVAAVSQSPAPSQSCIGIAASTHPTRLMILAVNASSKPGRSGVLIDHRKKSK